MRGADHEEGGKAQLRTQGHAASAAGVELGSVPEEARTGRAEPERDGGASGGSSSDEDEGLPMFAQSLWAALRSGRVVLPAGSAPGGAPARHAAAAALERGCQRGGLSLGRKQHRQIIGEEKEEGPRVADAALVWEPQTGLPAPLLDSEPAEPAELEPGLAKQVGAWLSSHRKTLLHQALVWPTRGGAGHGFPAWHTEGCQGAAQGGARHSWEVLPDVDLLPCKRSVRYLDISSQYIDVMLLQCPCDSCPTLFFSHVEARQWALLVSVHVRMHVRPHFGSNNFI